MSINHIDPYRAFNFRLEFGRAVGGFQEVENLSEPDSDAYQDKSAAQSQTFPATFILKRGVVNSELFEWLRGSLEGRAERRSGAIVMLDESQKKMFRWNFTNAWVSKLEVPTLNATSNDVAMEEIHLRAEGFELDDDD